MCPHRGEPKGNYMQETQLMRQPKYLKHNLLALINCISSAYAMDRFKASQIPKLWIIILLAGGHELDREKNANEINIIMLNTTN